MKALVIDRGFGLENLAIVDRPEPTPGPGQVLVRVRAASLNYRDILIARGHYNPRLSFPRVLGSDAAGEVLANGPGASRFKPGDAVTGCFMPQWLEGPITEAAAKSSLGNDRDGVLAEKVVFDEQALVHSPGTLTAAESATLPCAAVTAWNALQGGQCRPGRTILVQGTGGVSIFALQFARAMGARVFLTSSHDEKLARGLELGAEAGVNYKQHPDWEKWVRDRTAGTGVDIVVEVGGAGTLERSLKSVKFGGHVALIGVLAGTGTFNPMLILMKAARVQGVFVGSRAMFEDMNRFIVGEGLKPVIDRTFPFRDAISAFRHMESGSHFGKIVIAMDH